MKNEQWLNEVNTALEEISSQLGLIQENEFRWKAIYQVAASKSSGATIEQLFGNSFWARLKSHGRKAFKLKKPLSSFAARIPKDSVIFFKPVRERLIIASRDHNLLIKLVVKKDQFELFDEEVRLLRKMEESSFAHHVVQLRAEGVSRNGVRWIATTLADNSKPLTDQSRPERFILDRMHQLILEPMAGFYLCNGWKKMSIDEWIADAQVRSKQHPQQELLQQTLTKLQSKAKGQELVQGQLHFDLHAGNVLFDGIRPAFIDWEATHQGLLIIDVFDTYRRLCNNNSSEMNKLLQFLKEKEAAPYELRSLYQLYRAWSEQHFSAKNGMGGEDAVIILYAIERTLIYHEKWQADRLKDSHSFESKIINA